ncbi:hypothetical protein SBRCBS47491_004414 [Sporothrix bragantina]|uniref:Zn(2)-C6 fungal-type domain-containing protein n=1 Tax=Sporothrix bragantina TaxID=671064 RepID=A0ABP0BNC9_9PEZI
MEIGLPRKKKRVKTGCLTCRARKVKCDETPTVCTNCQHVQLTCTVDNVAAPVHMHTPTRELSERLLAAYFQHVHPYQANGYLHPGKTLQAVRDGTLPQQVLLALWAVSARFVSSSSSSSASTCPLPAAAWADEAGARLLRSHTAACDNIVTALLLLTHAQYAGHFDQHHLWCAVANRQALRLGLHRSTAITTATTAATKPGEPKESTEDGLVSAERDRLYFACYASERQMANGTPESVYCPAERIRVRLPVDELNYRMLSPGMSVSLLTPLTPWASEACLEGGVSTLPPWAYNDVGLMGFYVRLVGARFMVKTCVQAMVEGQREHSFTQESIESWAPWSSPAFAMCLDKLADIMEALPTRLRLTRAAVRSRHDSPSLGPLVILYLLWNMCHLELYRTVLPGYPESIAPHVLAELAPADWLVQARRRCLRHAEAMTAVLQLVADSMPPQVPPLTITDHTLPRFVYSAIRIQMELGRGGEGGDGVEENEHENENDWAAHKDARKSKAAFAMMLQFAMRTSVYFPPARLLCKAIRKMVRDGGMAIDEEQEEGNVEATSRAETPPHPWFREQKTLDEEQQKEREKRQQEEQQQQQQQQMDYHGLWINDFDFLDGMFAFPVDGDGNSGLDALALAVGMDSHGFPNDENGPLLAVDYSLVPEASTALGPPVGGVGNVADVYIDPYLPSFT